MATSKAKQISTTYDALSTMFTREELWDMARASNAHFKSITSKATADMFTEQGFAEMSADGLTTLNEWYKVLMPVYMNLVKIADMQDPLEAGDVGETFTNEYGEVARRLATHTVYGIDPAYRDVEDGPGADQFYVRKAKLTESLYGPNFDFASCISQPDSWNTKRLFNSETGYSEVLAGQLKGMTNGYIAQKYAVKKARLNAAIHDPNLQPTQVRTISLTWPKPTEEELVDMLIDVNDVISDMTSTSCSGAYNMNGFETVQKIDRLRIVARKGMKTRLKLLLKRVSYHNEDLNLPVPVVEVDDFGGLEAYADAEYTTPLYPVFREGLGDVIGFSETENVIAKDENDPKVTYNKKQVHWKDPNADVEFLMMDKGFMFDIIQNPYIVEPARNARNRVTTFWASSPNNVLKYDRDFTFLVFKNATKENA